MNISGRISLSELQKMIRDTLYLALPDKFWVVAEISEIKENYAGHCYIELIEKHPAEGNVTARIKAIIWNKRYRFLKPFFENATGESLKEGLKILVRSQIEYHELYGLSLIISDIDPVFTLGDMALRRQETIKQLKTEGVFHMNKELEMTALPRRVAVISSKNAAGYSDFINQLHGNSSGYVFYTALYETVMQGSTTEQSIIAALNKIGEKRDLFDVVVIIRGGGAQSDLSWFDSYHLAYHITQFPLPVITGIGHTKDMTVADMVAFESLKTPTAVAEYLISILAATEDYLADLSSGVMESTRIIIERNRTSLESSRIKISSAAKLSLSAINNRLSHKIKDVVNMAATQITRSYRIPANQISMLASLARISLSGKERNMQILQKDLSEAARSSMQKGNIHVKNLTDTLDAVNPDNVLKRGYTITSMDGKVLRRCEHLKRGDIIDTYFYKGSVKSKVVKREPKEKSN